MNSPYVIHQLGRIAETLVTSSAIIRHPPPLSDPSSSHGDTIAGHVHAFQELLVSWRVWVASFRRVENPWIYIYIWDENMKWDLYVYDLCI